MPPINTPTLLHSILTHFSFIATVACVQWRAEGPPGHRQNGNGKYLFRPSPSCWSAARQIHKYCIIFSDHVITFIELRIFRRFFSRWEAPQRQQQEQGSILEDALYLVWWIVMVCTMSTRLAIDSQFNGNIIGSARSVCQPCVLRECEKGGRRAVPFSQYICIKCELFLVNTNTYWEMRRLTSAITRKK